MKSSPFHEKEYEAITSTVEDGMCEGGWEGGLGRQTLKELQGLLYFSNMYFSALCQQLKC